MNIDVLIADLDSSNSQTRDAAAIQLMDIGDARAVIPLIKAICEPRNENHRGTLVYALSAFDCIDHFDLLVDLVLNGNFEVATGAFQIIEEANLTHEHNVSVKRHLESVSRATLKQDHNRDGYDALINLVGIS
jgi:HEAT repeat protein